MNPDPDGDRGGSEGEVGTGGAEGGGGSEGSGGGGEGGRGDEGGRGGGGLGAYTTTPGVVGGMSDTATALPATATMIHNTQTTAQQTLPKQLYLWTSLVRGPRLPLVAQAPSQQKIGVKHTPMKKRIHPQVGSSLRSS